MKNLAFPRCIVLRVALVMTCVLAQTCLADATFDLKPNADVLSLAFQEDGKVLVGGYFTMLGDQPRSRIGRLNADGSVDITFDPGIGGAGQVSSLALQPDGKILVGGTFTTLGGQSRTNIGRLNPDGSVDPTFNPGVDSPFSSYVNCLVLQPDGKILVGGYFTTLGGQKRKSIGRLNSDGSVDVTFNPGADGLVTSLVLQTNGKILVAGGFSALAGQSRSNLGRLNADGSLDAGYDSGVAGYVYSIGLQADGKALLGGDFTMLSGNARTNLGRLNEDGTFDESFDPRADAPVYHLAVQADQKILVGGPFTTLGGQSRKRIGRLNPDGTVDITFNLGNDNTSEFLALQADGRILAKDPFTHECGRLNNSGLALAQLTLDETTVTWLRGGTSPEVLFTTFEASTNGGASWEALGQGSRIPSGWQLGNINLSTNMAIRARGRAASGLRSASGWFCESFAGPRAILSQPLDRTNNFGAPASFTFVVWGGEGAANFYQWFKDGTSLVDNGVIMGAQSPTLVLTNAAKSYEGNYTVVLSNNFGCLTSAVARLTVQDPCILAQPIGLTRSPGGSAILAVTADGSAPVRYQWRKDGVLLSGKTNSSLAFSKLTASDAGYYDVEVSNTWGSVLSLAVPLTVNGAITDSSLNPGANGNVYALAPQPDGKILVGGTFKSLGGESRSYIGRINADGSIDSTFDPGAGSSVTSLALQMDGKVLVGGYFLTLGQQRSRYIGRLNPDGTLDSSFATEIGGSDVTCLTLQPDGKILVGGSFKTLGGQQRENIGRLNSDGTLDASFNTGMTGVVNSVSLQRDGRILVGGYFTTLGGQPRTNIGRLHADGSLDTTFNPGANGEVYSLAVQSDGKILVGGYFRTLGGQPRANIGRLHADGSVDDTFNLGADGAVYSFALQSDGKIIVGGSFTNLCGQPRTNIGRLNADGRLDATFNPGTDSYVYALALQADGKILAGGSFRKLGGQTRSYFGRLNNTEPATQDLMVDSSAITWLRGGASPEVSFTTFEVSTDRGNHWFPLGAGVRIADGWHLTGVNLSADSTIRARGRVEGGSRGRSSWFVESFLGPLSISCQPLSRTNAAGSKASFMVQAGSGGQDSNVYQWRKDGTDLLDGYNVSGAQSPALILNSVLKEDEGGYSVYIANNSGAITSAVASLSVADPAIILQPIGYTRDLGQPATLVVSANGTQPLSYQWRRNGVDLIGKTSDSLTLQNQTAGYAGYYDVVVSNRWGCVTSSVAPFTVNGITLDSGFNPGASPASSSSIAHLAMQPDGKILVGGRFASLGGMLRNNIGRLNPDGTTDSDFNPGANSNVTCVVVQPDGKILLAGAFGLLGGETRNRVGRLHPDGSVDSGFNPDANDTVNSMVLQPDGRILVGGAFTMLAGVPCNRIGRLNPDGSLQSHFDPGADGSVLCLALQPDGKVLVGGNFTSLGGQSRAYIGRLNPDGSLDTTFNLGGSEVYDVSSLVLQPDGKILVGGFFYSLDVKSRICIARLNANGSVDRDFNPGAYTGVYSLALQPDGKILVGGNFTTLGGQPRNKIGLLNPDGSPDVSFNPGVTGRVYSLAVQQDGAILVGGEFTAVAGQSRTNIARLNSTGQMLPRIASVAPSLGLNDHGFGFNFTGVAGSFVVIEGSPDLENWSPIQTNFLYTSVSTFRDPAVTNTPTRYYRVKVQQP